MHFQNVHCYILLYNTVKVYFSDPCGKMRESICKDQTKTNGAKTNGTETNGTETNGTKTNGTKTNGTTANGENGGSKHAAMNGSPVLSGFRRR